MTITIISTKKLSAPSWAKYPADCTLGCGQHLRRWGVDYERISGWIGGNGSSWVPSHDRNTGSAFPWPVYLADRPKWDFVGGLCLEWSGTVCFIVVIQGCTPSSRPSVSDLVPLTSRSWKPVPITISGRCSGPEQAVLAHHMVGGNVMVPVHWGLFDLALHGWTEPAEAPSPRAIKCRPLCLSYVQVERFEHGCLPKVDRWWPDTMADKPGLGMVGGCRSAANAFA